MTAVFITLSIVVALVSMSIINAARDVALAKHKANTQHCEGCTCDNNKEKSA
ncbi:hypothetical protein [Streptomyces antibioticus]|uniref:hypothetical protein n=1 Tax=Streptomyces antibioticus TaxID=1890 RepID=UPI0036F4CD4C